VVSCATDDCTAPTVLASGQEQAVPIAVDATSVYFAGLVPGALMKLTPK
jgi:hypothetical protein